MDRLEKAIKKNNYLINTKELDDTRPMPLLEGDAEELKEGAGLIILIPNKLLIRISVLLAQIKAGNNSKQKLEIYIRKSNQTETLFYINTRKSPKHFTII